MEIIWYGHSCFQITERGLATLVTDPYDHNEVGYAPLKLKADILSISHDKPGHNHRAAVAGNPYVVSSPGEYEVKGVFITGVHTGRAASQNEPLNTLYVFDFNGLSVAHLGDLERVPTQSEVEALGTVHIALVPVGGGNGLSASKASEVVRLIEPSIVIPMHYATPETHVSLDPLDRFLKEMGIDDLEPVPSLIINGVEQLPEETQVVVLNHSH
jgi:L-ascorbate metabolism protein UlaG (beta-lactamase superfamily)